MANEAIIKAAAQAYSPVQGQYDISGFVKGIGAIATGLVKRKEVAKKLKSSVDKLSVPTDIAQVGAVVTATKQKIIDKDLTLGEGVNNLKSIEYDVNKVIPKINSVLAKLEEKGLSLSVNSIDENYTTALKLGELNSTVKINGTDVNLFYDVNENNELVMLSPEGQMVRPNVLLARLEDMTTSDAKNPANALITSLIGQDFQPGTTSKFSSSRDAIDTKLNVLFENKKTLYSFLLDNPNGFSVTDKNEVTTIKKFTEHYINSGMNDIVDKTTGQTLKQKYDAELANIQGAEAKEKAQAMIIKRLMDDDPNLREDVQGFLNSIYNLKKPGDPTVSPIVTQETATGFKIKGKLNQTETQDFTVVNSVEASMNDALKSIKGLDPDTPMVNAPTENNPFPIQAQAMGDKVLLVRIEDEEDAAGVARFQWIQNMYGEQNADKTPKIKRLTNSFTVDPKNGLSKTGYQTIMQQLITNVPNGVSYGSRVYNSYNNHLISR